MAAVEYFHLSRATGRATEFCVSKLRRITHRALFLANCIKNYSTTEPRARARSTSTQHVYTHVYIVLRAQEISKFRELHAHREHMRAALYAHIIIM